jgi:hypothetical protein
MGFISKIKTNAKCIMIRKVWGMKNTYGSPKAKNIYGPTMAKNIYFPAMVRNTFKSHYSQILETIHIFP